MMNGQISVKDLTEGVYERNVLEESKRLVTKWDKTGLLEGLKDTRRSKPRSNMARLLENQARQILKESSTTTDMIGFQNVAFPMVRRVFAGLIANELVSVQPMSLPSGLLFFLDYRFDSAKAGNKDDAYAVGGSVFGAQTAPGTENLATGGFYNLGTSFSQREKVSSAVFAWTSATASLSDIDWDPDLSASVDVDDYTHLKKVTLTSGYSIIAGSGSATGAGDLKHWVPLSGTSTAASSTTDGTLVRWGSTVIYRRFTKRSGNDLIFIVSGALAGEGSGGALVDTDDKVMLSYVAAPTLTGGTSGTLTVPEWESDMGATPTPAIPEMDFRIQSVAVTAGGRKLKAKWTPELAQDLAAYQNMDADVELTQVLSEQIALEIDREILADLLYQQTGGTRYWSRKPGNFLNKNTGTTATGASFTGTVREWYETLIETIIDLANDIHRKTLRGAANFIVVSPDVATILEASVLYKPTVSMDPNETQFTIGVEKVGTLNNRFTVYKDPYFPRNKILVGFKGGSFLETGYVYAPYVPLIVTPVVYGVEDFTPRKAVMTRYAKKMVRSDFYGAVIVQDMNVI